MKRHGSAAPRRATVKAVALGAGAGALVIMGTVTVELSDAAGVASTVFVANTGSSAATTPTVASAAPPVKATSFAGGDWPGLSSGH